MTLNAPTTGADANLTVAVAADTSEFDNAITKATQGSLKLGSTLSSALDSVVTKGKSVTAALDQIALSISKMALNAAFKPIDSAFSSGIASLFSGAATGSPTLGFASGGVFENGLPQPFSSAGVIASPIAFPLAGGQSAVAGERGPEAIVPLTRGEDGKLGLGMGSAQQPVSVTFNVTSPDPDSFARSQSQISALLARAVANGDRNL